jgi:hypothetical protein
MANPIDKFTPVNFPKETPKTKSRSKDKKLDSMAKETFRNREPTSKRELLISRISKIRNKEEGFAIEGTSAKDKTYASEVDGNADICHVNPKLGLIYIVDGAGHNDPTMKRDLEFIFNTFNPGYEKAMKKGKFKTLDDAKAHVCKSMNRLHGMIREHASQVAGKVAAGETSPIGVSFTDATHDFEPGKLPAMSFGQIVKIKDKSYFLNVQFGDTSFVLQKANGELDFSLLEPIQDEPLGKREINPSRVHETVVQSGDRILASSDGIMEFIEQEDFETILKEHPEAEAPELLMALKSKVISRGEEFRSLPEAEKEKHRKATNTRSAEAILGANRRPLKTHDPDDRKHYDDLSLAIMTVA